MTIKLTIEAEPFEDSDADLIEKIRQKSGLSWHDAIIEGFKLLGKKIGVQK